jgi:hypothetical protein
MLKIKSNNISLAFEMLLQELNNEIESIEERVGELLKTGKFTGVREEVKYAEQLSSFRKRVASLLKKWNEFFHHKKPKEEKGKRVKLFPKRLPRGVKTPSKAYYRPILKALIDLGGKASVHEVLIEVEKEMKGILNEKDRESIPTNPNELRWVNTAKWARKDMTIMKPPLLKPDSAKKIWEITETGRKFLMEADR